MRRFPQPQKDKQTIKPTMNKEKILVAAVFHVPAAFKEHKKLVFLVAAALIEHKKLKLFIHDGKQTSRCCISFYA